MPTALFDGARRETVNGACPYCAGIGVLEATDMFCGAGGSSNGLEHVRCPMCGRKLIVVTQALNHWDLAVEAHNANFPDADHDVHDVDEIKPSRFRRTPLFWASPECVNHTNTKGKRDESPEAERSRATFKDIVRFTDHHNYDVVFVENVVEARLWCEHPKCACGAEFDAWFTAMCDLGYEGKVIYFNSQFALPTPQSRDRMYVLFWRIGLNEPDLSFPPVSWCSSCEQVVHGERRWKKPSRGSSRENIFEWGRYGAQYVYHCPNDGCDSQVAPAVVGAKSIIDLSLPIERIADKAPTYCKTCGKRHPTACKTRRRIKVGWERIGNRVPIQCQVGGNLYERPGYARVWSLEDPMRTVTGTSSTALALPERSGSVPASIEQPTPTVTSRSQLGVVEPGESLILRTGGQSPAPSMPEEPMNTITAHDRQIGLVLQNMANNVGRDVKEPMPPVTTGGNGTLVEFRGDHGSMRELDRPAHTITAEGTHHGMLVYNGVPGFVRDLRDAAGTITTRDKQAILMPYFRTGVARELGRPMGTVTTHDREALVITDADIDECYLRMLQWPELLAAQQMHVRPDGSAYELTARRKDKRGKMRELSNELRTKMIGNAVSSPVATMLGGAAVEILR